MVGDALLWASIMAVGQGVMRVVAGPARSDALARSRVSARTPN
jgi:hypothetical protein